MRLVQSIFLITSFAILLFNAIGFSQNKETQGLRYEVNKLYPLLSISKEEMNQAITISDINRYYQPSWVKDYISVEIWTSHDGNTLKTVSDHDILTTKQKNNIHSADAGSMIKVRVQYIPDNSLINNESKETHFSFIVEPDREASFVGGYHGMMQYFNQKVFDGLPANSIEESTLVIVKFVIDEQGHIRDVHVFESSKDEELDDLFVEAICNMPDWSPAKYDDGTKVKQEYALMVGNMESCVMNLLNVRREPLVSVGRF